MSDMTKYKAYFQKMLEEEKQAFDEFTKIHFEYSADQEKFQEEFNRDGEKILVIIKDYENRLCKTSEKAGYSNYTGNLAEKFQNEVKSHFPLIDHIGIITQKFVIRRINLKN